MLGVREMPKEKIFWQHFAFEATLDDMRNAVSAASAISIAAMASQFNA